MKYWQIIPRNMVILLTFQIILMNRECLSTLDSDNSVTTPAQGFSDLSTQLSTDGDSDNTSTATTTPRPVWTTAPDFSYLKTCVNNTACSSLSVNCITCKMNYYCKYGSLETAECTAKPGIVCIGIQPFQRPYDCKYAYQLDPDKVHCITYMATSCTMKQAPQETYFAPCTVNDDFMCLGNRTFHKKFTCNWTSGYKWSTALVLSVTLGGFGVDRFYLGLWREGIGKLFSFGGLGVWTIVDVILIAVGYVGPHDGSLYIYPWS